VVSLHGHSQDIEKEIKSLKSADEVNKYWQDIKTLDQGKRGLNSNDSLDNINYKKVIYLIKYHGYPKGSMIPNLIVTHQRSRNVNEYYFPIFYQAYKSGQADTTWFFHILRGIHRVRFGRDFVRGRKIEPKDVDTIVKRLSPYINTKVDLSTNKFDELFNKYVNDLKNITSSEVVYRWATPEKDLLYFYRYQNKLYYLKIWNDGSCGFPQEIKFNPDKNQYEYVEVMYDDFFKIDDNKNLSVFMSGNKVLEVKIEQ
jgi:hypothetical protein